MKILQFAIIILSHNMLKFLPYSVLRLLSVPIGTVYFLCTFRSSIKLFKRKVIFKELKIKYNPLNVKINYTRYWLETLWLTNKNFSKQIEPYVEIENIEYVDKLKKQYTGLIFALPHLGNWEFAIPIGNSIKLNLLAVAEPLNNSYVLNWFKSLRESLGIEIIIGGKGQNTFDSLVEKLKSGKDICLLSERSIKKSGVATEFFGQLAAFPKGPVALSFKTGVPIIPTAMIKTKRGYKLRFNKPFYVPYFENEATSIQYGLKTLSKSFEELLSLDINDWHTIQPVWTSEY